MNARSSVRPAIPADAPRVRAIVDAAYDVYISRIGDKPGPMLDNYPGRIARGQVWVLDDGTDLIGVLVLEETASGFLLDNIAVAPDRQGNGHGRILLEFAEQEAARRGWRDIQLYTNTAMVENIALYQQQFSLWR
ncbi:MAG: N-acetyltransferase [Acetobacteraceae bacterium]|nr:N-acetyltransferase [Acetobacteraceae bacterium]